MRNVTIAVLAGLLLCARRSQPPAQRVICNYALDESAELRFFVELAERANDRFLNDIRAFNAIAYMLLGPLLAIAAFVNYRDARNLVPLALMALSTIAVFASLWWGDGTPMPLPGKHGSTERLTTGTETWLKSVIDDLRRWAPLNGEVRKQKQRSLFLASHFTLLAIIATAVVKTMELR